MFFIDASARDTPFSEFIERMWGFTREEMALLQDMGDVDSQMAEGITAAETSFGTKMTLLLGAVGLQVGSSLRKLIEDIAPDWVENAFDKTYLAMGFDFPKEKLGREATDARIDEIRKGYLNLTPQLAEFSKQIRSVWNEVENFNKAGKLSAETWKILTDGLSNVLKPIEEFKTQGEQRIGEIDSEIQDLTTAFLSDPKGNKLLKERIYELQLEREEIVKGNAALDKYIKAREQDLMLSRREIKRDAETAIRERKPPDLRVSPEHALPGETKPRSSFFDDWVKEQLTGREQGRPIPGERPIVPSTKKEPTIQEPDKLLGTLIFPEQFKSPFGDVAKPEIDIGFLDGITSSLTQATREQYLSPDMKSELDRLERENILSQLGKQDLEGGLLDPSRMTDLKRVTAGLTEEWVELASTLKSFLENDSLTQKSVRTTREELIKMRDDLMKAQEEFIQMGGIPKDIEPGMNSALDQIRESIKLLGEELGRLDQQAENLESAQRIRDAAKGIRELQEGTGYWRITQPEELPPDLSLDTAISGHFERSAESLYDQFLAPSILDAVGIGSGRSQAHERALEELKQSAKDSEQEVRESAVLNERQKAEELLEINREYEQEKREIERQYEEERMDAWRDWVRQQLTDFPKLIFEQLQLQLAARATNRILQALGIGGNIPITGPRFGGGGEGGGITGFFSRLFGGGGGSEAVIPASSGGSPAGVGQAAAGLGQTAATVGTAASFALAAHNVATGTVPQWNPHGQSLYDDFGGDLLAATGIKTFFDGLHFANYDNDQYAHQLGQQRSKTMLKSLAKESAYDLAREYDEGRAKGDQTPKSPQEYAKMHMESRKPEESNPYEDMIVFHKDAQIDLNVNLLDDSGVQKISFKIDELKSQGRL